MRQSAVSYLAVLSLASGLAGTSVSARDPDLTEDEFLAPLLLEAGPASLALREELGARRADLASARTAETPELSATREDLGSGGSETEIGAGWRPPRPGRRRLEIDRATERLAAADASYAQSLLERRLDLRRIYAEWAVASVRVGLLESDLAALRELSRRSEARADAGEASGLEVRRLRLVATAASAQVAVARARLAEALGEVHAWRPDLGVLAGQVVPALPTLPPAPEIDPAPTSPRVASLEAELRAAEMETRLARKLAEMPDFFVGWKRVQTGNGRLDNSFDGSVVGLSWPVPLRGRGRAERQRAETRHDAMAAQLDLLRRRLDAERASARDAYEGLRLAVGEAETALAEADPAVTAASTAFRLGESDLTTLLDTLRNASGARLAVLELHGQALARQRQLERVRGQTFFALPELSNRSHNRDNERDSQ